MKGEVFWDTKGRGLKQFGTLDFDGFSVRVYKRNRFVTSQPPRYRFKFIFYIRAGNELEAVGFLSQKAAEAHVRYLQRNEKKINDLAARVGEITKEMAPLENARRIVSSEMHRVMCGKRE